MTLLSINITQDAPQVTRLVDKIGGAIQYGGFAAVQGGSPNARFVYLFGADTYGLQLAQVPLDVIQDERKRRYYHLRLHMWAETQPLSGLTSEEDLYLAGTFSSGSIFFSPYFRTFMMIYFNNVADSTFYLRYLDLSAPRGSTYGKAGHVFGPDDIEALGSFYWSPEMKLWRSPPTKHGYNYAGQVHPEYFNRLYYAPSVYSDVSHAPSASSSLLLHSNVWHSSQLTSAGPADRFSLLRLRRGGSRDAGRKAHPPQLHAPDGQR